MEPQLYMGAASIVEVVYSSGTNSNLLDEPNQGQFFNYPVFGPPDAKCDLCYEAMEFAYRNELIVVASIGYSNRYLFITPTIAFRSFTLRSIRYSFFEYKNQNIYHLSQDVVRRTLTIV